MSLEDILASIRSSIQKAQALCESHTEDQSLSSSSWSLHQHLEHMAVTGRSTPKLIDDALNGGEAPPMNDNGQLLFKLGEFPRGKTKAPDFAIPKGVKLSKVQQGFVRLSKAAEDWTPHLKDIEESHGRSEHPLLGGLTAHQWLVFLDMHQKHHLAIIEDGLNG